MELRVEDLYKDRNLFHMSIARVLENQDINRDKRDKVLAVKNYIQTLIRDAKKRERKMASENALISKEIIFI